MHKLVSAEHLKIFHLLAKKMHDSVQKKVSCICPGWRWGMGYGDKSLKLSFAFLSLNDFFYLAFKHFDLKCT